jgi:hypothetical protein
LESADRSNSRRAAIFQFEHQETEDRSQNAILRSGAIRQIENLRYDFVARALRARQYVRQYVLTYFRFLASSLTISGLLGIQNIYEEAFLYPNLWLSFSRVRSG